MGDAARAETAATGAGIITLVTGALLAGAPRAVARAVGAPGGGPAGTLAAIGVVDLVLAVGLLAGRPRWPWAVARAVATPPTAVATAVLARRHGSRALGAVTVALAVITVADVVTARGLRAADR